MKPILFLSLFHLICSSSLFANEKLEENIFVISSIVTDKNPPIKTVTKINKEGISFTGSSLALKDAPSIEYGDYIITKPFKKANGEVAVFLKYKVVFKPESNKDDEALTQRSKTQIFIVDIQNKPKELIAFNGKKLSVIFNLVDNTGKPITKK